MSKLDAQCRKCRRAGSKLMLKGDRCSSPKCAMVSRNYIPGIHGAKRRAKQSQYGVQLAEKQKAKHSYGMREKQFRILFEKAKRKGNAGENFLKMLETRLDNVIYRLGLAVSRSQARQMVSHSNFLVNDKLVNVPSFQVKSNDIIKIKKSKENNKLFNQSLGKAKKANLPGWLNWDWTELQAKVLHEPSKGEVDQSINSQAIVEFYSR
ncbi:MAG: 30S ribosomal protein S4 [bacterium]